MALSDGYERIRVLGARSESTLVSASGLKVRAEAADSLVLIDNAAGSTLGRAFEYSQTEIADFADKHLLSRTVHLRSEQGAGKSRSLRYSPYMRAILFPIGAPAIEIDLEDGLQPLRSAVGGDIESVTLNSELMLIVNGIGALEGLPRNPGATAIVSHLLQIGDYIKGQAILIQYDSEGETVPVDDRVLLDEHGVVAINS